jgi:hypothetical protein
MENQAKNIGLAVRQGVTKVLGKVLEKAHQITILLYGLLLGVIGDSILQNRTITSITSRNEQEMGRLEESYQVLNKRILVREKEIDELLKNITDKESEAKKESLKQQSLIKEHREHIAVLESSLKEANMAKTLLAAEWKNEQEEGNKKAIFIAELVSDVETAKSQIEYLLNRTLYQRVMNEQ